MTKDLIILLAVGVVIATPFAVHVAAQGQTAAACNDQYPTDDAAYVACLIGGLRMAETMDLPGLQQRVDSVLAALTAYMQTGERDEDWTASVRVAGEGQNRAQLYIETQPPDADVVCWPDFVSGGATVDGAIRSFVVVGTPSRGDSARFMCAGVGLFGGLKSAGAWSW